MVGLYRVDRGTAVLQNDDNIRNFNEKIDVKNILSLKEIKYLKPSFEKKRSKLGDKREN